MFGFVGTHFDILALAGFSLFAVVLCTITLRDAFTR